VLPIISCKTSSRLQMMSMRTLDKQCAAAAAPTVEQIDLGVAWSLEQKRQGRGVYVHCAHGHGRSNVVLCAVLISVGAANSIQEVQHLLSNRADHQC